MIQVTPQMRVLVAVDAVDFRRGIDGLAQQCRAVLRSDPFSGTAFVFCNRSRTAIKVLVYDGRGFWLCHMRLSSGSPYPAAARSMLLCIAGAAKSEA